MQPRLLHHIYAVWSSVATAHRRRPEENDTGGDIQMGLDLVARCRRPRCSWSRPHPSPEPWESNWLLPFECTFRCPAIFIGRLRELAIDTQVHSAGVCHIVGFTSIKVSKQPCYDDHAWLRDAVALDGYATQRLS